MNETQMTNNEIFSAMIDVEWAEVYSRFRRFMNMYVKGQEFGRFPGQPN